MLVNAMKAMRLGPRSCVLVGVLAGFLSYSDAHGGSYLRTEGVDTSELEYAHAVMRGTVKAVRLETVNARDWYGSTPDMDGIRGVFLVTLDVKEVLKGKVPLGDLEVAFRTIAGWGPRIGDDLLVCVYQAPRLQVSFYVVHKTSSVFLRSTGGWRGAWSNQEMSDSLLRTTLQSVTPEAVAQRATLAIVGMYKGQRIRELSRDGSTYTIVDYEFEVEQVLKGELREREVTVSAPGNQNYLPGWDLLMPNRIEAGMKWYLCLERGLLGWQPVGGKNGMLVIAKGALVYDGSVEVATEDMLDSSFRNGGE